MRDYGIYVKFEITFFQQMPKFYSLLNREERFFLIRSVSLSSLLSFIVDTIPFSEEWPGSEKKDVFVSQREILNIR